MSKPQHYTVKEVAQLLKVHPRTIQREIARHKLKAHKVGRKLLISETALNLYTHQPPDNLQQQIHHFCQSKKQEMIALLQKLVSLPSESDHPSHEEKLAQYLKSILEKFGIRNIIHGQDESITIQGTFGYSDKGILLNSPLDTIPAGNLSQWTYPPFEGTIKGGRMYGRGTADAKAGIVTMIYAVLALKELINEKNLRIELVFDGGEQNGIYDGMKNTIKKGLSVNAGIIGYANDEKNTITIGARGYHRYLFTTHGVAAHTGARYNKGINAITQMIKFISQVDQLKLAKSTNKYFSFGSRLEFSIIHGGSSINVVPDTCQAQLDIRTVPELTKDKIDQLIKNCINKLTQQEPDFKITYHYLAGHEAYLVDSHDPIVTSLNQAVAQINKNPPQYRACGPSHIGNLLHEHRVPVILCGPIGANVHSYNEYVEIDSLPATSEIYALTALNYFNIPLVD